MQSVVRTAPSTMRNPFMGSTMSYRVAAAPLPTSNAVRDVTTMAKKKVSLASQRAELLFWDVFSLHWLAPACICY